MPRIRWSILEEVYGRSKIKFFVHYAWLKNYFLMTTNYYIKRTNSLVDIDIKLNYCSKVLNRNKKIV